MPCGHYTGFLPQNCPLAKPKAKGEPEDEIFSSGPMTSWLVTKSPGLTSFHGGGSGWIMEQFSKAGPLKWAQK